MSDKLKRRSPAGGPVVLTTDDIEPCGGLEEQQFKTLATYNSEKARGIVHTEAWELKMADLQRKFNENIEY